LELVWLQDLAGESGAIALSGLLVGIAFGWSAQRSRFCLRAAVIEFSHGGFGPRLSVWLLCFSTGLLWTQALALAGVSSTSASRAGWRSRARSRARYLVGWSSAPA